MYINGISVNSRHNNPTVLSRTALLLYLFNAGQPADPVDLSSVSIFEAANNFYPSSVIGSDGLIASSVTPLTVFANDLTDTSTSSFDASNYSIGASGIYRLRQGLYAVILDGDVSSVGDYIDVWTLRRVAGSDFDTIVNEFTLNDDRFFSTTEPVMFRVSTKLMNKFLVLGSKEDLKFTNEFTIENTNIDRSVVNLLKNSLVMNPSIEIYKENSARNLASRVMVSSFAQTSGSCEVTSDNTVIFNFDTDALLTHPQLLAGQFDSVHGVYVARLKFTALNQTFVSNYMPFTVR